MILSSVNDFAFVFNELSFLVLRLLIIIIIITCFIRCWQNAAKYNHQVGLIHIKVDKTMHSLQMK